MKSKEEGLSTTKRSLSSPSTVRVFPFLHTMVRHLHVFAVQTRRQEECPRNTLRFSVKYSEFPIYDINPFLVEY